MIGQIRGVLVAKSPPEIAIEVNGLTYEIQVPMSTLYQLPELGQQLILHTHFVVREDAQILYGFANPKDKDLFRALVKVNGVGPKMALAILSGMDVDEFVRTVQLNDVAAMTKMPGIGQKTAARLIVEMRDRLTDWEDMTAGIGAATSAEGGSGVNAVSKEAESALISLGYKPQQAARAIAAALKEQGDIENSEELIRAALRSLA